MYGADYERIVKKVNIADYIITPPNPEKVKMLAEEKEMMNVFDSHI